MIPELNTAFCGCSVRTGSKVISWVTTVLGIMQFIVVAAVIWTLAVSVSSTDDEQMGKEAIKKLKEFGDPELQELVIGNTDTSEPDPEVVGRQLKVQLKSVFTMVFLIFLVVFLFQMLFSALLLIGVYKNKSGYVGFYLVISLLGLVGYFPTIMFNTRIPFDVKISAVIGCLIHLYFTWVIYSFYKELRRPRPRPNNPAYSMAVLLPGQ